MCNFTIVNMQLITLGEKKIDNFYHNFFGATFHRMKFSFGELDHGKRRKKVR